jgi:hypothetical protein
MTEIISFRDLIAWQKAMDLADRRWRRFIPHVRRRRLEDLIAEVGRITAGLARSIDSDPRRG